MKDKIIRLLVSIVRATMIFVLGMVLALLLKYSPTWVNVAVNAIFFIALVYLLYNKRKVEPRCAFYIMQKRKLKSKRSMTLNEYQNLALETAIYPKEYQTIYPALGLTGEAGECSDKIKKVIRDNNGEFTNEKKQEIAKEIGDVLWYCAALAHDIGYTLEEIANLNVEKLHSRKVRNKLNGSGDNR